MNNLETSPLLKGKFGAGGAGNLTRFLLALLALAIQSFIFSGHLNLDLHRISSWMPLVIGLLFLALNFTYTNARGNFFIFHDRLCLEGNGKTVEVKLEDAAKVSMDKNHFALYDIDQKILMRIFNPQPVQAGGLLWLWLQYKEKIPALVWKNFKSENSLPVEKMALRVFLDEDGTELFSDPGFILESKNEKYFFPIEDAQALPYRKPGFSSVNQALSPMIQPLRLEPAPALLPLFELTKAIANSNLDSAVTEPLLHGLAEEHGGMMLKTESEPGTFQGEMDGFKVEVVRSKSST